MYTPTHVVPETVLWQNKLFFFNGYSKHSLVWPTTDEFSGKIRLIRGVRVT